jgi:hypothetical protein
MKTAPFENQRPVSSLASGERQASKDGNAGGVKKIPKLGMKPGKNVGSDEIKLPISPEFPSRG